MRKLLLILILTSITHVAQAGYLIEPYIGAQGGSSKFEEVTGSTIKLSYDIIPVGSKVGWRFGLVSLVLNPRITLGNAKDEVVSWRVFNTDLFVDVGFHFGPLWSLFFGVSPATSQKLTADNAELIFKGTNMHFGLGYKDKGWNYGLEFSSRKFTRSQAGGGAEEDFSTDFKSMTDTHFAATAGYTFGADK